MIPKEETINFMNRNKEQWIQKMIPKKLLTGNVNITNRMLDMAWDSLLYKVEGGDLTHEQIEKMFSDLKIIDCGNGVNYGKCTRKSRICR